MRPASTRIVLVSLFFLIAAPTGIWIALLTPPGMVPDEPAHLTRAAGLLHGEILGTRELKNIPGRSEPRPQLNIRIEPAYFTVAVGRTSVIDGRQVVTAADTAQVKATQWSNILFPFPTSNTATYFPTFYLPATAALGTGRLLGATPFQCFRLARLAMLGTFLLLGCSALWLADRGRAVLLTTLFMPMTLFLAASLNEDGVLIAAGCLAAAALTKHPRELPRMRIIGAVLLVLIAAAKPPYLPLLGVLLLPLHKDGFSRRLTQAALSAIPVLTWVAIVGLLCAVPFEKPPYHPGPLWIGASSRLLDATDPGANARILLAHPTRLLTLPWHYVLSDGQQKLKEAVGILGLLSLNLDDWCYQLWGYAVGFACLTLIWPVPGEAPNRFPMPRRLFETSYVLLILVVTCWSVMISMYVNWTDVGQASIDGIQGRYLLVLLPFAILIPSLMPMRLRLLPWLPAIPTVVLAVIDLGYLPTRLASFFYLQ